MPFEPAHPPPLRPTPVEIATGVILGQHPDGPVLPGGREDPVDALERAILPALRRPPCLVLFSGGRDSSAILAVAARAARRHGLAAPIPLTLTYRDAPGTDEREWQELVIAHLGLTDWTRLDATEDLDLLSPRTQDTLLRHGVTYPPVTAPILHALEEAAGGAVLGGNGGDQLFGVWRARQAANVLARRTDARPRDLLRVGLAVAPARVRASVASRRSTATVPWLRPPHRHAFAAAASADAASEPFAWTARMRWWLSRRRVVLFRATLARLAREAGALYDDPFYDPGFAAALGRAGGRLGFGSRTAAMEALFGPLLPPRLVARATKAGFAQIFAGPHVRRFLAEWDGSGIDPDLVDRQALLDEWTSSAPHSGSAMLLHEIWLTSRRP